VLREQLQSATDRCLALEKQLKTAIQQAEIERERAETTTVLLTEERQRTKELEREVRMLQRDNAAFEKKLKIDQFKGYVRRMVAHL